MRKLKSKIGSSKLLLIRLAPILLAVTLPLAVWGQDDRPSQGQPPPQGPPPQGEQFQPQGPGLVRLLNLSPEQIEQIRLINRENNPLVRRANIRHDEAQRSLDEAIYSDTADEALIEERVKQLAAAQAIRIRLRALTELRIRRVLTGEQLARLREIRERQQALNAEQNRRMQPGGQPPGQGPPNNRGPMQNRNALDNRPPPDRQRIINRPPFRRP